ncbi:MAG: hypothetical protein K5752_05950, partial [Succinivibrionaceae bacterium]|jgi:hypothetical protein|nr:hypothetical protein [Succinivibrionaceae bacterium]
MSNILNQIKQSASCSKCGSKNIEVSTSLPKKDEGFSDALPRKIKDLLIPSNLGPLAGSYYIICKDCGHIDCM